MISQPKNLLDFLKLWAIQSGVADFTNPNDPYFDPLPSELEQCTDEARADAGLDPVPQPSIQGIADMKARIKYHTDLLAKLRAQPATSVNAGFIAESQRQLAATQTRLNQYQAWFDSRN